MKNYVIIFLISVIITSLNSCGIKTSSIKESDYVIKDSLCFGKKTPGLIPKPFVTGVLDKNDWVLEKISPDMKKIYLTSSRKEPFIPRVVVINENKNLWEKSNFYPTASGNDSILYSKNKYIKRTDSVWSEVKSLGTMFENKKWNIMRLSASDKGTYVFDHRDNIGTIRYSRMIDGKREKPKEFGKEINSGIFTCHPLIAPDDSYIIWDSEREDGYGETDLYICFMQEDGLWGKAINMGENINTKDVEGSATITPDGKFLFFIRQKEIEKEDGSIYWEDLQRYWVSTKIIENLRQKQ